MSTENSVPEWLGPEESMLRVAGEIGKEIGYGNLIAHLMREWQIHLMRGGLPEESARLAVIGREPYPLDFHRPSGLPEIPKRT